MHFKMILITEASLMFKLIWSPINHVWSVVYCAPKLVVRLPHLTCKM